MQDSDQQPRLSELEARLLNGFQRDLPLRPKPFAEIAQRLGATEYEVIGILKDQEARGTVSRVGPVFQPHAIGTSTLAAMAVPSERLDQVASIVSGYQEVNHNYEREHHYNVWFVLTATSNEHLARVVEDIEQRAALPVLSLPMQVDYHIDLGFRMRTGDDARSCDSWTQLRPHSRRYKPARPEAAQRRKIQLHDKKDWALLATIQWGVPVVSRPFAAIARRIGLTEEEVLRRVERWLTDGIIKRMGVIVRHRELGYGANAMVVWDVADGCADEFGQRLARADFVSLCYRRARHRPEWPYNVYCMIHGRNRISVTDQIRLLVQRCGAEDMPYEVLFSRRCFKQRGAVYHPSGVDTPAAA